MRTQITLITALFFALSSLSIATEKNPRKNWFQTKNCTSLEITKFASSPESSQERKIDRSIELKDAKVIQNLMSRIEKIPKGKKMISFAPDAEQIDLSFHCEGKTQLIQIFEKKFQTPSTGFNARRTKIEARLYSDIQALLQSEADES